MDPAVMVRELKEMGMELMVSILADRRCREGENCEEMAGAGLSDPFRVRKRLGQKLGDACIIDVTNPGGRACMGQD